MPSSGITVLLAVIDAVGVATLEHLLNNYGGEVNLPNLSRLGLARILDKKFAARLGPGAGRSFAGSVRQASASADSVIGHREMMGIIDPGVYRLFPEGFPADYISAFEKKIGRKTIFNRMAGGIEAIELNASEHEKTGSPIVYASKCDPLIQIAMNENVIPVSSQHSIADAAFELALERGVPVTRAISRSYTRSEDGEIVRTVNRHDAVLPMKRKCLVDVLYSMGVWTTAVGKTSDLVNTRYHEKIKLTDPAFLDPVLRLNFVHPKKKDTNPYSAQGVINALISSKSRPRPAGTFIFANFVDTDSLYGHTRDVNGAVRCLEEFDRIVPVIEKHMGAGDVMIITADHGMEHRPDYGYHNNEPLPLIIERMGCDCGHEEIKTGEGGGLTEVGGVIARFFGCGRRYRLECCPEADTAGN